MSSIRIHTDFAKQPIDKSITGLFYFDQLLKFDKIKHIPALGIFVGFGLSGKYIFLGHALKLLVTWVVNDKIYKHW